MYRNDMISKLESWRLAKLLIEQHGDCALRHARNNAEKLLFGDDIPGGNSWMRVARAVDVLLENEYTGRVH